jgi:hypothetical protein
MHRISRRMVAVLVVVGALAAGGAAYTNSITATANNTAGYADQSVQGASLTDAVYGLSADGSQIKSVTFTFANDLTNDKLQFLLDSGSQPSGNPLADCVDSSDVALVGGVIDASLVSSGVTTVTCDGLSVPTGTPTHLVVAVTNT